SRLMEILEEVDEKGNPRFKVKTTLVKDLYVSINKKSITLRSNRLKKIFIRFIDDTKVPIIDFFNRTSSFIINFERVELVYSHRKLFRDNRLLGNIEAFLSVFKPHPGLVNTTSEKGDFSSISKHFSNHSVFWFVENIFISNFQYFICDDLGNEWADHIGLNENNISFFHSKYNDSSFSASDFQDIVGQAQKNLGNLIPTDDQLHKKDKIWKKNYIASDGTKTQIKRLTKGSSSLDAINYFKNLKTKPNLTKKVYLVVNFLSKADLTDRLEKLQKNISFKERNQVIQILWFVSSLVSSSNEVNAETYIICKP
ncbi:hypothetical protein, partial [Echinicola sediminis]